MAAKKPCLVAPCLFVVLLTVSFTSFLHSVYQVSPLDHHAVKVSLNDFKQDGFTGGLDNPDDALSWNYSEAAIPNPEPASGYDTFSACLLVMDDNHRLVEWVAFHYHVLPLRYLIVAVDPRSKTSPTPILNRWRKMGVYIEEWDDYQIFRAEMARNAVSDHDSLQVKRDRHRSRQKNFYRLCLKRLHLANRTYTMLIDTDEFLMYNHAGRDKFEAWEREQQRLHAESRFADKKRIRPSQPPPSPSESGAMMAYIRQEKAAGHPFFQSPCISCPRSQFGAKESTLEQRQAQVPDGFIAEQFDTLRFRKHVYRNDFVRNGLSKSIIDVSQLNPDAIPRIMSLHRPIKTICSAPWKNEWDSGLRINHYLGSWESYSFRDDARRGGERSREGWEFKAQEADDTDDNIRPWMDGFVRDHGPDKSKELLQGSGIPKGYKNANESAWTIMFLNEILSVNETKGNDIRIAFDNFVRDYHRNKGNEGSN